MKLEIEQIRSLLNAIETNLINHVDVAALSNLTTQLKQLLREADRKRWCPDCGDLRSNHRGRCYYGG